MPGKGQPRISRIGKHAGMFKPPKTVAYEGLVAMVAKQAMAGRQLIDGLVLVELTIVRGIPQSMSKKRKVLALVKPMKQPGPDNVLKAICDGCNGAVWRDDVQNTDGAFRRRWGEIPGVHVKIVPLLEGEQ